jgi:hypothetical protein
VGDTSSGSSGAPASGGSIGPSGQRLLTTALMDDNPAVMPSTLREAPDAAADAARDAR